MPVTVDQPAPYAPASAILGLIERHRNKGLPPLVDADVLARAGISQSLVPRTLHSLKTLDLVTEEGRPTEVFEAIRLAPTAEYQNRLSEWLKATYADALAFVDPATDDEVAVRDAFRKYIPHGQQPRMVSLFMGLFTAAGVMPQGAKVSAPKRGLQGNASAKPKPGLTQHQRSAVRALGRQHQSRHDLRTPCSAASLPPAIAGLLATLPAEGGDWTQAQRDGFMTALGAVIDYTYKIGEPSKAETETATDQ